MIGLPSGGFWVKTVAEGDGRCILEAKNSGFPDFMPPGASA